MDRSSSYTMSWCRKVFFCLDRGPDRNRTVPYSVNLEYRLQALSSRLTVRILPLHVTAAPVMGGDAPYGEASWWNSS